jgi:hypothetical protein
MSEADSEDNAVVRGINVGNWGFSAGFLLVGTAKVVRSRLSNDAWWGRAF